MSDAPPTEDTTSAPEPDPDVLAECIEMVTAAVRAATVRTFTHDRLFAASQELADALDGALAAAEPHRQMVGGGLVIPTEADMLGVLRWVDT